MQIKLNGPKNYKHLENFIFEVIGEKPVRFLPASLGHLNTPFFMAGGKYSGTVSLFEETHYRIPKSAMEQLPVTKLKVVSVSAFSLPFDTDCRNEKQKDEGHAPIHVSENPTKYSKNGDCLLGMELTLDLSLFTVVVVI